MKTTTAARILIALASLIALPALAQTCGYVDVSGPQRVVMPLQSTIMVGPDVAVGTVLYYSGHSASIPGRVSCGGAVGQSTWRLEYQANPGVEVPGWPGHYPTNIPGVAIRWWRAGLTAPGTLYTDTLGPTYLSRAMPLALTFSLIKTGPITPGTLQASTLPKVRMRVRWGGSTALDAYLAEAQGQLNIVSATCNARDVTVPMGEHRARSFTGVGSASGWVDFSIGLRGCPAFFGVRRSFHTSNAGTEERLNEALANAISYRADPSTAIVDGPQSIMALSNANDPAVAKGIGIQVALPNNAPIGFGTYRDSGLVLTPTVNGSYDIPLRARYIQTQSRVLPGRADGTMVVTFQYR
jgi:type 1 fimbria pilin